MSLVPNPPLDPKITRSYVPANNENPFHDPAV